MAAGVTNVNLFARNICLPIDARNILRVFGIPTQHGARLHAPAIRQRGKGHGVDLADVCCKDGRAEVNDVGIPYNLGGTGETLLLLHGHSQTKGIWHKLASRAAQQFSLVATRRIEGPARVLWGRSGVIEQFFEPIKAWGPLARQPDDRALDCGHYVPEEARDELASEIEQFFTDHS